MTKSDLLPLYQLIQAVKQPEFYVPRDYQTVGGMWTVDTWRRGDIEVLLMDEGYTTKVFAPGLEVVEGFNGEDYATFHKGSMDTVMEILKTLEQS